MIDRDARKGRLGDTYKQAMYLETKRNFMDERNAQKHGNTGNPGKPLRKQSNSPPPSPRTLHNRDESYLLS